MHTCVHYVPCILLHVQKAALVSKLARALLEEGAASILVGVVNQALEMFFKLRRAVAAHFAQSTLILGRLAPVLGHLDGTGGALGVAFRLLVPGGLWLLACAAGRLLLVNRAHHVAQFGNEALVLNGELEILLFHLNDLFILGDEFALKGDVIVLREIKKSLDGFEFFLKIIHDFFFS